MFNKKRCEKCEYGMKYSGIQVMSRGKEHEPNGYLCGYCILTNNTCLTVEKGKVIDRRGEDPGNCKIFKKGTRKTQSIKGRLS